ncbi:NADP-dependent oxidoreductase [Streptomyces sp. NPDC050439]|uniref:NADP-dependent oxidoreductase n=1 Tax=unclassified Streptomyces TaxID=2593676 RepID=UPI00343E25A4
MSAIRIDDYGSAGSLRLDARPLPALAPGEVLVRVHAAGVNPIDWETRAGRGVALTRFPAVLGWDVSGIVTAVGPGPVTLRVGDEVFGTVRFPHLAGGYAQFVAAPADHLAVKPPEVPHLVAAASAMPVLTALQTLFEDAGRPLAGSRVLIHGAAGGVGQAAVQLAKREGATVIATASTRNHAYLLDLGADQVVDYVHDDIRRAVPAVDLAVDPRGGEEFTRLLSVVTPGGTLVTLKGEQPGQAEQAAAHGVRAGYTYVRPDGPALAGAAELLASGAMRTEIQRVLPLEQAGAAHELGEHGRLRGRLVLDTS